VEPLAIRPHRPWLRWAALLAVLAALGGVGWLAFEQGRERAGFDRQAAEGRLRRLAAELERLRGERDRLEAALAKLERARRIDQAAQARLRALVDGLQAENGRLREELAFYRRVVGPREGGRGVRIQSFAVERGPGKRLWRYKLVLSQSPRRRRLARGVVHLVVEGSRGGERARLGLDALAMDGEAALPYRFRYFQYLEGTLRLPEGFVPERLVLQVRPRGTKETPVERAWAWSDLTEEASHVGQGPSANGPDRDAHRAEHADPR